MSGGCYHVLNRANARATVFHDRLEYRAFLDLIDQAQDICPVPLLAACVMPNHFHLVVVAPGRIELSRWVQWLQSTHSHRYNVFHERSGHVWQGRYKSFPIQQDDHLLTVLRYVERNPVRAGLALRADAWPWGSLAWRTGRHPGPRLAESPVRLPRDWDDWVNWPQAPAEVAALRASVNRQRPFGTDSWARGASEEPVPFISVGD
ncbi:MAG: transposase [Steroidobacteraceae bacterium]